MPTVGVFAAIFDAQGRVLCVRQGSGQRRWSQPGGRVEPGETPVEALVREVREETGCAITVGELVGVYSTPHRDAIELCFRATVVARGPWRPTPEIAEFDYFARDALPAPMRARTRARIEDAFDGRTGVVRVIGRDVEDRATRRAG